MVAELDRSAALPRWDMTPYFSSLDSRQFAAAQERLGADVDRMAALYDHHDVRGGRPAELTDALVAAFGEVLDATNDVLERLRLLSAYVNAFVTTDARDDQAAAVASELQMQSARVRALSTRFDAWVATLGAEALIERSPAARDHAYPLRKAEVSATHQMDEGQEALYAELALTGSTAWNRLHGDVTALITAPVEGADGSVRTLPITVVRNLAADADGGVRRRAYEAELAGWERVAVPCAAALNSIKGEANTVNAGRRWADPIEAVLHANAVDRPVLEAMQHAVVESLPDWRRYLRAKALRLGSAGPNGGLPWWDLFAPVGDPGAAAVGWDEATTTVTDSFATYSPALAGLARRALDERWVDAEAREGKRGGAFCMGTVDGESRVLLNFGYTFDSVSTLAHELGHAYHNSTLAHRTAVQRATPMALAETASIFCETLLTQSVLANTEDPGRRLAILDYDLQGSCQVVVDIHSRFLFETEVFDRRRRRTLAPRELCELMLGAQDRSYGDGLDEQHRHAYMWAVKPHYYMTHFYNWPYTFGLLFGLGLYAAYQEDPERFRAGYDDLLSSTGLADASGLAARFGIDVGQQEFWASSLAVLSRRIDQFERLAADDADA
jgi:pepF/M3 family oligoendopeptidase